MHREKKVSRFSDLNELKNNQYNTSQLMLVERTVPEEAELFFNELMKYTFSTVGKVKKDDAENDVRRILNQVMPSDLQKHSFYDQWILDMTDVCIGFCAVLRGEALGFWLGTERSCGRYHVDNVPFRTLVTYAGKGTEYLPDSAANRGAYENGETNDNIIKDKTAIRFMNAWDVAVFMGGPKGLLHRSPDEGMSGKSILMRLDGPNFWDQFNTRSYLMKDAINQEPTCPQN